MTCELIIGESNIKRTHKRNEGRRSLSAGKKAVSVGAKTASSSMGTDLLQHRERHDRVHGHVQLDEHERHGENGTGKRKPMSASRPGQFARYERCTNLATSRPSTRGAVQSALSVVLRLMPSRRHPMDPTRVSEPR